MRAIKRNRAAAMASALLVMAGTAAAGERPAPAALPRLGACGIASGGFLIPGTDACLTLGGSVWVEGRWGLASPKLAPLLAEGGAERLAMGTGQGFDRSAIGTSARLTTDVRIPTELGPVRVFVSLRGHKGGVTDRAAR